VPCGCPGAGRWASRGLKIPQLAVAPPCIGMCEWAEHDQPGRRGTGAAQPAQPPPAGSPLSWIIAVGTPPTVELQHRLARPTPRTFGPVVVCPSTGPYRRVAGQLVKHRGGADIPRRARIRSAPRSQRGQPPGRAGLPPPRRRAYPTPQPPAPPTILPAPGVGRSGTRPGRAPPGPELNVPKAGGGGKRGSATWMRNCAARLQSTSRCPTTARRAGYPGRSAGAMVPGRMPAIYLGHGAPPPLVDDPLWVVQLEGPGPGRWPPAVRHPRRVRRTGEAAPAVHRRDVGRRAAGLRLLRVFPERYYRAHLPGAGAPPQRGGQDPRACLSGPGDRDRPARPAAWTTAAVRPPLDGDVPGGRTSRCCRSPCPAWSPAGLLRVGEGPAAVCAMRACLIIGSGLPSPTALPFPA